VLEIQDVPCRVYLSTTGRAVRVDLVGDGPVGTSRRRSRHDAIRSQLTTTSRREIGAVTNRGRLIRFSPVDLPVVPAGGVQLGAGTPIGAYLGVGDAKEHVLGLVSLDGAPLALGTAGGVVKRVAPGAWPNKPVFEVIALKDGDEVVGVGQGDDTQDLVFVTAEGQLLRFGASAVRPQGVAAGGVAGVALTGTARALAFAAVDPAEAVVATISAADSTLDLADPGRGKLTSLTDFPAKGRATAGVRAQTLLRGESGLKLAWIGPAPALAVARDGSARPFPDTLARRDASGASLEAVIDAFGTAAQ
jgi:DNA gyrase subunit A